MKKLLIITATALLAGAPASALPFRATPEDFRSYLNKTSQTGWRNGDRIYFNRIGSCSKTDYNNTYSCWDNYVTISSPQGSKVCLAKVVYRGDYLNKSLDPPKMQYGKGASLQYIRDCRWLKDSRFADS